MTHIYWETVTSALIFHYELGSLCYSNRVFEHLYVFLQSSYFHLIRTFKTVQQSYTVNTYLQESFMHSGLRHLKTLSSGFGIIVWKLQKGQATKSSMPAAAISSCCLRSRMFENMEGFITFLRVAKENSALHSPSRHRKVVLPCPISSSTNLKRFFTHSYCHFLWLYKKNINKM